MNARTRELLHIVAVTTFHEKVRNARKVAKAASKARACENEYGKGRNDLKGMIGVWTRKAVDRLYAD